MFCSLDNNVGVDSWTNLSVSTECIIEALEVFLTKNNSTFAGQNLTPTNGTGIGAANFWSFLEIVVQPIDYVVIDVPKNIFQEILCFAWYRNDCVTIWTRDLEKANLVPEVLDQNLNFTIKIGSCLKITNHDKNLPT